MNAARDISSNLLLLGVGALAFSVYIYFLSSDNKLGYFCSGGFFILFAAEHIYNFIGRTSTVLKKYIGTKLQLGFAFVIPSLLVVLAWLTVYAL